MHTKRPLGLVNNQMEDSLSSSSAASLRGGKARNPYQIDTPDPDASFVGREDIVRLVETELRSPERSMVLLHGPPRIGKTAVLHHLQRRLPSPPFLPFYLDLMGRAHSPLSQVLRDLAAAMAQEVGMPAPEDAFDDEGVRFRTAFLPAFFAALPEGYRPVLLLDDLHVLATAVDRPLPETCCARAFAPFLTRLSQEEGRLGFVFASLHCASDLPTEVQELVRAAREKAVGLLPEADARELVLLSQHQGALSFAEDAPARVYALCAGHPYFTQLLCHQIFAEVRAGEGDGIPLVHAATVEAAVKGALRAATVVLEGLLAGLGAAERVLLLSLCGDPGETPTEELRALLARHGVRVLTRELELAPDALVGREILRRGEQGLGFAVEMMRRFLLTKAQPGALRAEIEGTVPLSQGLFQEAGRQRDSGDHLGAQESLRRALRLNPNHVSARLLLSELLLQQGQLEKARREADEARLYDPQAARGPLLRVMLAQAEEMEGNGEDEAALQVYEEVLALAPHEAAAQGRRQALLVKRGDEAVSRGELQEAIAYFEKAGRADRVAALQDRSKSLELRRMADEAVLSEATGDLERAEQLYRRLSESEPSRYAEAAERVGTELQVRRRYADAQDLMARSDWTGAMRVLGEVTRLRPGYRDAEAMLTRAADGHVKKSRKGPPRALLIGAGAVGLLALVGGGAYGLYRIFGRAPVDQTPNVTVAKVADRREGPDLPPPRVAAELSGPARAAVEQGIARLGEDKLEAAIESLRQAHRLDPRPQVLYNLALAHDRLRECDDAAFLYRAAMFGKGVQPEDQAMVEARLEFLEQECHFKKRQATVPDRRARAARYMEHKLCALADSILDGIATHAEEVQVAQCLGRPAPPPPRHRKPAPGPGPGRAAPPSSSGSREQAQIVVNAKPWANVFVDGVRVGMTPVRGYAVSPGKHVVLLVNEELGKKHSYPINATPGTTYTINYTWESKR